MNEKFSDLQLEPDTRLYYRKAFSLGGFEAIFEWWSWDGDIEADSVIFCSEDVAGLSEEDLKTLISEHFKFDKDDFIFNRGPQYTLLNFNFR